MSRCSEVMTKDPACCLPGDTCQKAAKLMGSKDIGSVPIVEDVKTRELTGIVTDRDLTLKLVAQGRDPKATICRDVMTKRVKTCRPDDDLQKALDLMTEQQIRRICVVDENNKLVGIVSQADIATRVQEPIKVAGVVRAISQSSGTAHQSGSI